MKRQEGELRTLEQDHEDEHDEQGGGGETPFFQRPGHALTFDDAVGIKTLFEAGGAERYVSADGVKITTLRKLRSGGALELLMGCTGTEAQLTRQGVNALPHALTVIAAGPMIGGAL